MNTERKEKIRELITELKRQLALASLNPDTEEQGDELSDILDMVDAAASDFETMEGV